jgi:hypothetical protein
MISRLNVFMFQMFVPHETIEMWSDSRCDQINKVFEMQGTTIDPLSIA